MEQSNGVNIKSLRERFQNENSLMFRTKPAIPVKPQIIPSPPSKVSNPLVASINSAMKSPTHLAPRVIFKDDKKSLPETSPKKMQLQFLDKNQRKEGDLIIEALRSKKTVVQPKSPVFEDTSRPEPNKTLRSLVKDSTSIVKNENEQTKSSEWHSPATSMHNTYDPGTSTPFAQPTVNLPSAPEAPVHPVQLEPRMQFTDPTVNLPMAPKPAIPAVQVNSTSYTPVSIPHAGPVSKVQTVPEPDITSITGQPSKPDVTVPNTHFNFDRLPEEQFPPSDMFDFFHDIPPPVIPEDFTDSLSPGLDTTVNVTPVFINPASPSLTTYSYRQLEPSVTPDFPLHPDVNSVFTYSPLPTPLVMDVTPENKFTEYPKEIEQTERSKAPPSPALSALARAEEMTPIKPRDTRLFNLLEKAKRKAEGTPESVTLMETGLPVRYSAFEFLPPETPDAERSLQLEAPEVRESFVIPPAFPPVDYGNEEYNILPAMFNGQDHVPNTVPVHRSPSPPIPPPKFSSAVVPDTDLSTPVKPAAMMPHIQPIQILENSGLFIPAPEDFTFSDSKFEDTSFWDSPAETSEYGSPVMSVHEEELPDQPVPEHYFPNLDSTDSGLPSTHSVPDSPVSQNPSSPSGKQEMNFTSPKPDDQLAQKKMKPPKKQKSKSLLNPYADNGIEEIPRKTFFSKKHSVSDENDLKTKQKQKEKDKEKEIEKKTLKEKEKREQKEKKKEREKELKEKEKEKKELKEKEKDKKEIKEKERGKKEQKEKEKKENELRKKFKITGDNEVMYQAKVIESSKGRKDDLAVKSGEVLDIIRTTDCPKGKWLARDCTKTYGYIPVENLKLDFQEMLEMGKKAKSTNKINNLGITDSDERDSRSPNQFTYPESFEDDSEEWAEDDDTIFHPTTNTELPDFLATANPVPLQVHQVQQTNVHDNVQTKNEALQKLTTFFAQPSPTIGTRRITETEPVHAVEPVSSSQMDADFQFVPPPDLYADIVLG